MTTAPITLRRLIAMMLLGQACLIFFLADIVFIPVKAVEFTDLVVVTPPSIKEAHKSLPSEEREVPSSDLTPEKECLCLPGLEWML